MKFLLCLLAVVFLPHCGPPNYWRTDPPNAFNESQFFQSEPDVVPPLQKKWFRIIVLDVGEGDATLLIAPEGNTALIDTGPPERGAKTILEVIEEKGLRPLETLLISHHHEDHIGSLDTLTKTKWGADANVIDKTNAKTGEVIPLGSVQIQIKAANGQIGKYYIPEEARGDENNLSLALLVTYKKFSYFTDGDLPGGGGNPPYTTWDLESDLAPLVGDIDILLVPHHGSHTSTNETFLNILRPEAALLSLGDFNPHYHPHPSVIQRLKTAGISIFQTERGWLKDDAGITIVGGHICVITDGERTVVKPYSVDKCAEPL